ncbi:MAG: 3-oxoacyl-ACP reductase, partial [Paenibacillus sp. RIFOXYA1_FULL_44_5]
DLQLQQKSVFVAAGSRGLGLATALEYAREGANVTIASRNPAQLKQAYETILDTVGKKVLTVQMDVAKKDEIEYAIDQAVKEYGGLDVLITNAGGPPSGGFSDFADESWELAFEQNLLSVIRLIRTALPHMRVKGAGRIVNITSTSVKEPLPGLILSNVFRSGVQALTKSLAQELASELILVNSAAPGRIHTSRIDELDKIKADKLEMNLEEVRAQREALIPLQRYGTPEEFARAVVFLGSYANTYVTGQTLLIDGGMVKSV